MQHVQLPLLFLEQFVVMSRALQNSAPQITCPMLVVQGQQDTVVRPALTRKLLGMFAVKPPYKIIPGEHHIVMPDSPAFGAVAAEIITFLQRFA
jgi:pimeloyl-ACP methyl ester carboxylesterase